MNDEMTTKNIINQLRDDTTKNDYKQMTKEELISELRDRDRILINSKNMVNMWIRLYEDIEKRVGVWDS